MAAQQGLLGWIRTICKVLGNTKTTWRSTWEGSLEEMEMGRSRDGNNVLHGCGHFKPSAATCSLGSKVKDATARLGSGLQKAEQGEWFLIQS